MKKPLNPHKKGTFAYQQFNTILGYIFNGEQRPDLKNLIIRRDVLEARANDLNTNWKAAQGLDFEAGIYSAVVELNKPTWAGTQANQTN
jgi:hypothetical protein